jgi:hypothetical protein
MFRTWLGLFIIPALILALAAVVSFRKGARR